MILSQCLQAVNVYLQWSAYKWNVWNNKIRENAVSAQPWIWQCFAICYFHGKVERCTESKTPCIYYCTEQLTTLPVVSLRIRVCLRRRRGGDHHRRHGGFWWAGHSTLQLLSWHRLNSNLCGLSLLLQLLQLLSSHKTDRLVPSNYLGACWHSGQNDVSAQITNICAYIPF